MSDSDEPPVRRSNARLRTDGPRRRPVRAPRSDGRHTLSWRRSTNAPIEGAIGFGLKEGMLAFDRVEVCQHRDGAPTCGCGGTSVHHDAPLAHEDSTSSTGRRSRVDGWPARSPDPAASSCSGTRKPTRRAARLPKNMKHQIDAARADLTEHGLPMEVCVAVPAAGTQRKDGEPPPFPERCDPRPASDSILDARGDAGDRDGAPRRPRPPRWPQRGRVGRRRNRPPESSRPPASTRRRCTCSWDDRGVVRAAAPNGLTKGIDLGARTSAGRLVKRPVGHARRTGARSR